MKAIVLVLLLAVSSSARADDKVVQTCESFEGARPWHYCLTEDKTSSSKDVLYFLHGGGGGALEEMRQDTFKELRAEYRAQSLPVPRIVQVSFGPIWALFPANENPNSGLLEVFEGEILTTVEQKALKGSVARRLVAGHSMGGLNSAILGLLRPKMFAKIAMTAPAPLLGVSPFATEQAVADHAAKTHQNLEFLKHTIAQYQYFLSKQADYEASSPIAAGPKGYGPQTPPTFMSVSQKDTYYYHGMTELIGILKANKVPLTVVEHDGGHSIGDDAAVSAMVKFLGEP